MNIEVYNLLMDLLKFKSVSGGDECKKCIDFCINYFKDSKLKIFIKEIEVNGVKSVLFTNVENCLDLDIMEIGHIDVVPASQKMFKPEIKDNIIYGRGTGDMKGFVAVAMKLFEYMIKNNINLKCGLLIVSDEEPGGFYGAKYWSEEIGLKTKILLEADSGSKLNQIIYKSKGCFIAKLISKGISAHGSKPWLADDANENLMFVLQKLRNIFPYYSINKKPNDNWTTTMHVAQINGGSSVNSVADYAEAILDIRYTEDWDNNSIIKAIKDNMMENMELIVDEYGIPVYNDINNKYLQLYKDVIENYTKERVIFNFETGAGDSRYFKNQNKDTIIIANQSDCGNLHSENEWLDLEKLSQFFEIRKKFINNFLNGLIDIKKE